MTERKDALGDRLKTYERIETEQRFAPNTWLYVRLDGRGFSKLTKGLARPFDARFSELMKLVTKALVKEFAATIGYTQSDEISLLIPNTYEKGCIFNAKKQKLISTTASFATSVFTANISEMIPEKNPLKTNLYPSFDCRIFSLGSDSEAVNALLWREHDAIKNSVSMSAHHHFSHKELLGINSNIMKDMLKTKANVNWDDYPAFFKQGSYFKRQSYFTEETNLPRAWRSRIEELPLHLSNRPHEYRTAIALGRWTEMEQPEDKGEFVIRYNESNDADFISISTTQYRGQQ